MATPFRPRQEIPGGIQVLERSARELSWPGRGFSFADGPRGFAPVAGGFLPPFPTDGSSAVRPVPRQPGRGISPGYFPSGPSNRHAAKFPDDKSNFHPRSNHETLIRSAARMALAASFFLSRRQCQARRRLLPRPWRPIIRSAIGASTKPWPPPLNTVSNFGWFAAPPMVTPSTVRQKASPGIVGNSVRFTNPSAPSNSAGRNWAPHQPALNTAPPFSIEFWAKPIPSARMTRPVPAFQFRSQLEHGGGNRSAGSSM